MNKDSTVAIGITLGVILVVGLVVYFSRTKPTTIPTPNPLAEIETPETTMTTDTNIKKPTSKSYSQKPTMVIDEKKDYSAVITTSLGVITIDLLEKIAPETVNNFVFLAKEGFYNDTFFHRVIDGFMIQGGDPTGTGAGSPGYKFADEILEGEYTRGTLAMANSGPNTNGSQFFIMHQDNALPNNYVIFGKTLDKESLKTIDTIAASKVAMNQFGERSTPVEKTYITSIEIVEK